MVIIAPPIPYGNPSVPLPRALENLKTGGRRLHRFHPSIKRFFTEEILAEARDFKIELSPAELGRRWGVAPSTVGHWLSYFRERGWLKLIDGRGGRGRRAFYEVTWLRRRAEMQAQRKRERLEWQGRFAEDPHLQALETVDLKQVADRWAKKPQVEQTKTDLSPESKRATDETDRERVVSLTFSTGLLDGAAAGNRRGHQEGFSAKTKRPGTPQERVKALRTVGDEIILIKGGRFYRWTLEQFRLLAWRGGAGRREGDIICGQVGKLIDGRPLGFARKLAAWLVEHIAKVLRRLRKALRRGLRAAHAEVSFTLRVGLELLKPKARPKRGRARAPGGELDPRRKWDLNTAEGRRSFLKLAREIADRGGGRCPRCGKRIIPALLELNSGLAFEREGLCSCIFVALDREARAGERRNSAEGGISESREAIFARRMMERGEGGRSLIAEVMGLGEQGGERKSGKPDWSWLNASQEERERRKKARLEAARRWVLEGAGRYG